MNKTKIICTIGPSTESEIMLKKLVRAGMNIARLNFSHGTYAFHKGVIDRIKKINEKEDVPVALLLDTQGPEIRTTVTEKGAISLHKGDQVKIGIHVPTRSVHKNSHIIGVNYSRIIRDVEVGSVLLVDSGIIQIRIYKKNKHYLSGTVLNSGILADRKHINLPGVNVDLKTITEKDKQDILFGLREGIDFIAVSFVRQAKDIISLRKLLKKYNKDIHVIAKIEHPTAVENLDSILEVADGVMVARGDLAMEVPFEEIPILQRRIEKKCIEQGKQVIIATQMLESMVNNPFPTRAEITDIANAVLERTDAIMLSGETTSGKFPVESVETMRKIADRVEKELLSFPLHHREKVSRNQEITRAACLTASNLNAAAVLLFTEYGHTAANLSNFRPKPTVYAFSEHQNICRRMNLFWGTIPYCLKMQKNPEDTIRAAIEFLKKRKKIKKNDLIVIISDIFVKSDKVNDLQIRTVL